MTRILVLGGGQQGFVVATELSKRHQVIVGDKELVLGSSPHESFVFDSVIIDAEVPGTYVAIMEQVDLVVGCLPSCVGTGPVEEAAKLGVDFVDLSFTNRNLAYLNPLAKHSGSTILYDCGLAPGLSNMLVGRALEVHGGKMSFATILVGGISKNQDMPYGYVNSWSLPDLKEEYTRTARYVKGGKIVTAHPLYTKPEIVSIRDRKFEAFYNDGVRSMLALRDKVPNITELGLRWPGHMAKVHALMDEGRFVSEFENKCHSGQDMVVLRVTTPEIVYDMEVDGDQLQGGLSAMAKTTAYSCAAFVESILSGVYKIPGVSSPEEFGGHQDASDFVLEYLRERNIEINAT